VSRKLAKPPVNGQPPTLEWQVVRPPYVGRLTKLEDWRREIGRIYREMRRGELATENGTRLTYVANIGAQLAKFAEEMRELEALRQQLARIQQQSGLPALPDLSAIGESQPVNGNGSDDGSEVTP
jgi:hypothetical protein